MKQVTTPWRDLLKDFRADLDDWTREETIEIDGRPQVVVIDAGKFPGHPLLRTALWGLHEALEEIENYQAKDHNNDFIRSENGRDGGRPPLYREDDIKDAIRTVLAEHQAGKPLKGTQIIERVQALMKKHRKPIPGKTKILAVLGAVREEDGEKIR